MQKTAKSPSFWFEKVSTEPLCKVPSSPQIPGSPDLWRRTFTVVALVPLRSREVNLHGGCSAPIEEQGGERSGDACETVEQWMASIQPFRAIMVCFRT
ncbi:unnamed protein product [Boreogadus saida]